MKVAVLYSGMPRFSERHFNSQYENILQIYNPDIYISTYDDDSDSLDKIIKNYNPKKIHIEKFIDVEKELVLLTKIIRNRAQETKVMNVLSMYYKLYRSFNLLEDDYDIIIRNRFDNAFDKKLELEINNLLNVPKGGDHRRGLLDIFAYGNMHNMFIYHNLILFLGSYLIKYNILFHPETLLRYHCIYNNISINRFDYNVYLRNSLFTATAPTY